MNAHGKADDLIVEVFAVAGSVFMWIIRPLWWQDWPE
jgi:hypothetical protein